MLPPKKITTTRIRYVWTTGHIGWTATGGYTAVPVTESYTTPGYSETYFYKNIRVNFLDYSELKSEKKLEIPPLIWIGDVESQDKAIDIRVVAWVIFDGLLKEFPKYTRKAIEQKKITWLAFEPLVLN